METIPRVLEGSTFIDDRGKVSFFNNIFLQEWKRFYMVQNHSIGFIRAWHAHKEEIKLVIPISGTSIVAAVKVDNWVTPDPTAEVFKFVCSVEKPNPVYIPAGFANGFKTLTEDAKLLILSSSDLETSKQDDFRFPWNLWNCWEEDFR